MKKLISPLIFLLCIIGSIFFGMHTIKTIFDFIKRNDIQDIPDIEESSFIDTEDWYKSESLKVREDIKRDYLKSEANKKAFEDMKNNNKHIKDLIRKLEGCHLKVYKDIGGIKTIGCGNTSYIKVNPFIIEITPEKQEELLEIDVNNALHDMKKLKININTHSLNKQAAIIAYIFHVGRGNFKKQPIYKILKHNSNYNIEDIKKAWLRGTQTYILIKKIKGREIRIANVRPKGKGLYNRRLKELKHFIG